MTSPIFYPVKHPKARLLFAHGAGAGMDHPFMTSVAQGLTQHHYEVVLFEFPYMQKRREDGKKRLPDRSPVLEAYWHKMLEEHRTDLPMFIMGKSMGGRIASIIADDTDTAGVICLGFPFHPPGKPEKLKSTHLMNIQTPTLILQGERDTFGNRSEVSGYVLSKQVDLVFIDDGDHSFKPRKSSGFSEAGNLAAACHQINTFITERLNQ